MTVVDIVSTGVANTASVRAAFRRLGCETRFVAAAEAIGSAAFLVLPGVGAFDAAMGQLRERDFVAPLRQRIADRQPTLAICLGMQLLGAASEESQGAEGLACVAETARRFGEGVRVPHMGWTRVETGADCAVLQSGSAYFAHSYRWDSRPGGWGIASATCGAPFVAAIESGPVVACQFHPELSGEYGADLLRRWLRAGGAPW